jgi:prepilin peptidase CpaA
VLEYPLLLVFPLAMAFAGTMDLLTYTIPNRISLALVAGFLLAAPLAGMPWHNFFAHLGAGFTMLVVGMAMFSLGWVGGGDAKLLAAAALWLGFGSLVPYLAWTAVIGGNLAIMLLLYRRYFPLPWAAKLPWAARLHDSREGIPYGVALAAAGLLVYPSVPWVSALAA